MNAEPTCPECGAELPQDALTGLCPRCLLGAALAGQIAPSATAETPLPLGQEGATGDASTREVPTGAPAEFGAPLPAGQGPAPRDVPTVEVPSPSDIPTGEVPAPGETPAVDVGPGPA